MIPLVPIHELGHYAIAKLDNATITDVNFIGEYTSNGFKNPHIIVNEFTFSSLTMLFIYYLAGFLATFIIGAFFTIVLIYRRSPYWVYAYSWIIITPLISLSDITRVIELMDWGPLIKWVHVGLGALFMSQLSQIRSSVTSTPEGS